MPKEWLEKKIKELLESLEEDEDSAVTGIFSSRTYSLMEQLRKALED